jgi:DNA-binding transcriptional regulator WhiA
MFYIIERKFNIVKSRSKNCNKLSALLHFARCGGSISIFSSQYCNRSAKIMQKVLTLIDKHYMIKKHIKASNASKNL